MLYTLIASLALGSWGTSCGPVGSAVARAAHQQIGYSWQEHPEEREQLCLYRGRLHIGSWNRDGRYYRSYDRACGRWGERVAEPPYPLPAGEIPATKPSPPAPDPGAIAEALPHWMTHGVEPDRIVSPGYRINGRPIIEADAIRAIEGRIAAGIPCDALRPWLVLVASAAECVRLTTDMLTAPALSPYRDRVRLQTYQPGAPMLTDRDGKQLYGPGLSVVLADGREAHRQESYTSAEQLAEALRKSDPLYDPKKSPDLTRPTLPGLPDVPPEYLWTGGLAALFVFALWMKRGEV